MLQHNRSIDQLEELAYFTIERDGNRLELRGELDVGTLPLLDRAISLVLEDGFTEVEFGLADLTFIDCVGLGELVRINTKLRELDGKVILSSPSEGVRRILDLTQLTEGFLIQ